MDTLKLPKICQLVHFVDFEPVTKPEEIIWENTPSLAATKFLFLSEKLPKIWIYLFNIVCISYVTYIVIKD